MELGKRTIWLAMESARTAPTWHAIVDGSPNPAERRRDQRCRCRCWHDRRRVILHCLHDFLDAVGADDPGHRSDRKGLTWLEKDNGAREADHLARHGISTRTLYLARHCRRNMVGSLPRGMPTVVDESMEVRVIGAGR